MESPLFPATYSIDSSRSLVTVIFSGEPSFRGWASFMDGIFTDPLYRPGYRFLVDRRQAPIPETKNVRGIVQYIDSKENSGASRGWALLVADLGSFGMGRMAEELSSRNNAIRVFMEPTAATEWLDARFDDPSEAKFGDSKKVSTAWAAFMGTMLDLAPARVAAESI